MNKKQLKFGVMFLLALFLIILPKFSAQAATVPTLEVGEVRSLGNEAKVPVTLYRTTYLTSIDAKITLPSSQKGITLKSFEPAGIFAGEQYRSIYDISENTLSIDFLSQTLKEPTLANKPTVIGYITYTLSSDFKDGESVKLELDKLRAKGRANADILIEPLHGKIERKLPIGGVVSDNGPSAAAAMRILQHVDGSNLITEKEMILSADVDGNGKLNQDDAQHILDYLAGIRTSFLAIETIEFDDAAVNSDYAEKVAAKHGREPYTYKNKGTLPSGLKLNQTTGELTGKLKTAKDYAFTIIVTDAIGNTAERAFSISVIDSNIASVEKIPMINVKKGGKAALPTKIVVTYKDKSKGYETINWDDADLDTTVLGETIVKGTIGNSGFTIHVIVNVVDQDYSKHLKIHYLGFLNLHTIVMDVSAEVSRVTINNIDMHYEGENKFSLASSSFTNGATVTIRLYDKYGNILETKSHSLLAN